VQLLKLGWESQRTYRLIVRDRERAGRRRGLEHKRNGAIGLHDYRLISRDAKGIGFLVTANAPNDSQRTFERPISQISGDPLARRARCAQKHKKPRLSRQVSRVEETSA
jgi:hypothetical protein